MKKVILLCAAIFTLHLGFAQTVETPPSEEKEEMATDRPSAGDASRIVPQGRLQVELGLKFKNDETNFFSDKEYGLPEMLVHYGLFKFAELRLRGQLTHRVLDVTDGALSENHFTDTGFDKFMVGTKFQLLQKQGIIPEAALQADFQLPIGHRTLKRDKVEPKLRLNFTNKLTENLALQYNLGVEWEENEKPEENQEYDHIGLYTFGLQYQFTKEFSAFIEAFGEKHENDMQQSFDAGIAYKLMPNLQFDAYAGVAACEEAPDYFVSAGVSFRLPN